MTPTEAILDKKAVLHTKQIKAKVLSYRGGRIRLMQEIGKSIDAGEYAKAGFTLKDWIVEIGVEMSVSHFLRQLHDVRALKSIPADKLEAMPEGNANALSRLPEHIRKDSGLVARAVSESPAEFRETVAKVKEKRLGIKPERWETYARRLPGAVYDAMLAAEGKLAGVLHLNIEEGNESRQTNLITILEALASLVNGTPEERLIEEIEGKE